MNTNIKRIVYLGKMRVNTGRSNFQRRVFLTVKIEYKKSLENNAENNAENKVKEKPVLSICGVIGPTIYGNAYGSYGQCCDDIWPHDSKKYHLSELGDLDYKSVYKLLRIWRKYHLNNLRVGCEHQRARGENWALNADWVCPDCGHKLGSSWQYEKLPQDVIDFIVSLPTPSIPHPWGDEARG